MSPAPCPYLGLIDNPETPLGYASFENRCYATVGRDAIPLSEQSVFCLGGQFQSCPRYMALHGPPTNTDTILLDPVTAAAGGPPTYVLPPAYQEPAPRRDYSMAVILGGLLVGIFLCLGGLSAYLGLRSLVNSTVPTATPEGPVIVVIPRTPTPSSTEEVVVVVTTPTPTPTPTGELFPPVDFPTSTPTLTGDFPSGDATPTPTLFPEELATPTRRPPPTLTPAATTGLTPTVGGIMTITFTTTQPSIQLGQCTTNSWSVQNAVEVRYNNVTVAATGSRQECPTLNTTYTLEATDASNGKQIRTLTVTVNKGTPTLTLTTTITPTPTITGTFGPTWTPWPTATPTVTPTPVPTRTDTPTPTPTSLPPTDTPTPTATPFNVDWDAEPLSYQGPGPNVDITYTNVGTVADTLSVGLRNLNLPEGWTAVVCFASTCGERVNTNEVSPGKFTAVRVRFTIPDGVPIGTTATLSVGAISTQDVSVTLSVPITIVTR